MACMSESICSCDVTSIAIKIAIVTLSSMKEDDLRTPQTYPLIYLAPYCGMPLPNKEITTFNKFCQLKRFKTHILNLHLFYYE